VRIYDISMKINKSMMVYSDKEENRPQIKQSRFIKENGANETVITLNVHTGTHLDAPLHMIDGGAPIESISVEKLVTKCRVLDFTNIGGKIGREELEGCDIKKDEFIIFKTTNSNDREFNFGFVFLDAGGAEYLANIGIRGVGTDSLGIERSQPDHRTHTTLMSHGIIILEGLRLAEVEEGEYLLVALPLKLEGVDGAPARAVLIRDIQL